MLINSTEIKAQDDYQRAVRQAFWGNVRQWLGRGCNDLLSTGEVFRYLKNQPSSQLGLQSVPLGQIVGSSGKAHDFDLAFRPRRLAGNERWVDVAKAQYEHVELPPVLLTKVGEAYFVEDGNHRVSAARVKGESTITAKVIEIDVSNLKAEPSCTRLGYKLDDHRSC